MSYQNYTWEVAAHDYHSPYLRNHLWTQSFFKYQKLLGVPRAVLGIASKNNQIEYLADFSTWIKTHEALKENILADFGNFEKLINQSIEWGEKMNAWTEENIFEKDLTGLSGAELISLLRNFVDMQENEYTYGSALPILDFSNFSFIEGNLKRILEENVPEEKFQDYYSIFTEPENNSFSQEQEESLLALLSTYWEVECWRKDLCEKDFDEVVSKYPQFSADLSTHTKKYGWVYYVYMGPAFSDKDFFAFVVDYANKDIDPKKKLTEMKEKRTRVSEMKEQYLKELQLTGLDEFILKIASRVVWAKPRRKDYQSKSYFHVEKLCREIAKRLFISLDQVRSLPIDILEKSLNGEKIDTTLANTIKSLHICLPNDDGSISTLVGVEAEEFFQNKIKRNEDTRDISEIKELRGSTACVGRVVGIAKIINVPEDMVKMEEGNILVSSATTPSIVPAMKKAAAIVTDEGGLTCHAAIVSRELNTPCIVGLKIVTKYIKDGDRVEVDANKAIVRRLDKDE